MNARTKPFLVDFIGASGCGKSTLIKPVAEHLKRLMSGEGKRVLLVDDVSSTAIRHLWALVFYPRLLLFWRLIAARSRLAEPAYKRWGILLGRHAAFQHLVGLKPARSSADIYLFDEGLVTQLARNECGRTKEFLANCPMPQMIVHIMVDPAQAILRKLSRSKPVDEYHLKRGAAREQKARRLTRLLMKHPDREYTRKRMTKWSYENCRPPLTDQELEDIWTQERHADGGDAAPASPEVRELRPVMEQLGIAWLAVDNNDGEDPEAVARNIAGGIYHAYRSRHPK